MIYAKMFAAERKIILSQGEKMLTFSGKFLASIRNLLDSSNFNLDSKGYLLDGKFVLLQSQCMQVLGATLRFRRTKFSRQFLG